MSSGSRNDLEIVELIVTGLLYPSSSDTDDVLEKGLLLLYDKEHFDPEIFGLLVNKLLPMLQLRIKIISIYKAQYEATENRDKVIDLQYGAYLKNQGKQLSELTNQYIDLVDYLKLFISGFIIGAVEGSNDVFKSYLE